jgi:hypothetical protein
LICLWGWWQESFEATERPELASHHTLQIRTHLRVVWNIARFWGGVSVRLLIVLLCCTAVLLDVGVVVRVVSLIVADMLVER